MSQSHYYSIPLNHSELEADVDVPPTGRRKILGLINRMVQSTSPSTSTFSVVSPTDSGHQASGRIKPTTIHSSTSKCNLEGRLSSFNKSCGSQWEIGTGQGVQTSSVSHTNMKRLCDLSILLPQGSSELCDLATPKKSSSTLLSPQTPNPTSVTSGSPNRLITARIGAQGFSSTRNFSERRELTPKDRPGSSKILSFQN